VIDKDSDDRQKLPLWFRMSLAGSRSKRSAIIAEFVMLVLGFVSWIIIDPNVGFWGFPPLKRHNPL